jgi:hypothetical protein
VYVYDHEIHAINYGLCAVKLPEGVEHVTQLTLEQLDVMVSDLADQLHAERPD